MNRVWISVEEQRPADAITAATLTDDGDEAGFLAAWSQRRKPTRFALRADPRLIEVGGEAAWVSLVLAPAGVRLPFDDPAVVEARRRVLSRRPYDGISALMRDASHFEGSIAVARGPDAVERLIEDPFARIFPPRLLHASPGMLGGSHAPVGPSVERYGSANPWPGDRFGDTP